MGHRTGTETSELRGFQVAWTVGPFLASSVLPSMVFGVLLGQWGSNLVWGSVYGFGWCVAAFASGSLRDPQVAWAGLLWAWTMPLLFWFGSGWLWRRLTERGQRLALMGLAASMLIVVPADTMLGLESAGIHLPDFGLHAATSF